MTSLGALSTASQLSRADVTASAYQQATGGPNGKLDVDTQYGTWITLTSVSITAGTYVILARAAVGNSAEAGSTTSSVDFDVQSGSTTVAISRNANRETGTNSSTAGSANGRTVNLIGVTTVATTTTVSLRAYVNSGVGVAIGGSVGTGYGANRLLAIRVDGSTALGGISSTTEGLGHPSRDLVDSSATGYAIAGTSFSSILAATAPTTACKSLVLGVVSADTSNNNSNFARIVRGNGTAATTQSASENLTSATGRLTIPLHALVDTSASESIALSTRVTAGTSVNWYSIDFWGYEIGRSSRLVLLSVGGSDTLGSQRSGVGVSQRALPATTYSTSASPGAVSTSSTKYGSTLTPTEAGTYLAICTYRSQAAVVQKRVIGRLVRNGTTVDDAAVQAGESGTASMVQSVTLFHVGTYNGTTDNVEFRASGTATSFVYDMTLDLVRI